MLRASGQAYDHRLTTRLRNESLRLLTFGLNSGAPEGGSHWLDNDGIPDPARPIFTWVTARMVHVYSLGTLTGFPGARAVGQRALTGLHDVLHDPVNGGWYEGVEPDGTKLSQKTAYSHAFVLLAASSAVTAGLEGSETLLDEALSTFEAHFWDEEEGLCVDEWTADWSVLSSYRGVNANMHAVEALLAASDVTKDPKYLNRGLRIADRVINTWARSNAWRIPEHFTDQWAPLLEMNRDRPGDPFKPYGATVGHGFEWARLLLHLDAAAPDRHSWLVPAAENLFDRARADGWITRGPAGFIYTTDWNGEPVVKQKMHWVAAEAAASAAALHQATGKEEYLLLHRDWWNYIDATFIDRTHGSWHHELNEQNRPETGTWSGKPDLYHAFQATLIPRAPLSPGLALAASKRMFH